MADLRYIFASAASAPLLPLLALQGRHVRRVTPRLPVAAGPSDGTAGTGLPPLGLLVIGDSTAVGVGASRHELALTGQVAAGLAARLGRTVVWSAVGCNGATASSTRSELVPRIPERRLDTVLVALGVNDVLRLHSPARWRRDLELLVAALRERVGRAPIVIAAMPPVGRFPALPVPLRSALGWRAAALARATHKLAFELDGVSSCSRGLEHDVRYFAEDRFHPSELGYLVWAELVVSEIAPLLSDPQAD